MSALKELEPSTSRENSGQLQKVFQCAECHQKFSTRFDLFYHAEDCMMSAFEREVHKHNSVPQPSTSQNPNQNPGPGIIQRIKFTLPPGTILKRKFEGTTGLVRKVGIIGKAKIDLPEEKPQNLEENDEFDEGPPKLECEAEPTFFRPEASQAFQEERKSQISNLLKEPTRKKMTCPICHLVRFLKIEKRTYMFRSFTAIISPRTTASIQTNYRMPVCIVIKGFGRRLR
ncbi:hypothetical protein WR25_04982 isoform E [Diploscapter pachys]|uniref:C2H2-type domain-containing protein n=1 Tax=Diploscapter pachys TaxID=2018661 RepID=A0A2A2J4U5_9BILA|nr:hypothetical protein WR25_04982 isoform D [Diploscapter pachys]PAV56708.1 hypothetical protein WR25_04982 isoform E [Diploscapter pachys]